MIAEISPQIGGAPEATAIPRENGTETMETTSPASMSWRQCFSPARPFRGVSCREVALSSIGHHSPESRWKCEVGGRVHVLPIQPAPYEPYGPTRSASGKGLALARRRVPGTISRRLERSRVQRPTMRGDSASHGLSASTADRGSCAVIHREKMIRGGPRGDWIRSIERQAWGVGNEPGNETSEPTSTPSIKARQACS